ncbi:MAG: hypothetical protein ACODAA_02705 [Gemmatimonadota bacterium]
MHERPPAAHTEVARTRRRSFREVSGSGRTRRTLPALAGVAMLLVPVPASPQEAGGTATPTACVDEASHRFDFLAGEWIAESRRMDESGEWHETRNAWSVETVLGGCAFVDYVDGDFGSGRLRGMGTRYYEPGADRWYITWMSTEAPGVLEIWEGGFDESGDGHFHQEIETASGTVISRIRWWDIRESSVEWEHALSRDGGETWSPTWRMTLRRTGAES